MLEDLRRQVLLVIARLAVVAVAASEIGAQPKNPAPIIGRANGCCGAHAASGGAK